LWPIADAAQCDAPPAVFQTKLTPERSPSASEPAYGEKCLKTQPFAQFMEHTGGKLHSEPGCVIPASSG